MVVLCNRALSPLQWLYKARYTDPHSASATATRHSFLAAALPYACSLFPAQVAGHLPVSPHPSTDPLLLQLSVGDYVPVATPQPAGSSVSKAARPVLARVTALQQVQEEGVFMPHTLTGAVVWAAVAAVVGCAGCVGVRALGR